MDADFLNVLTVAGPATALAAWRQDEWTACADAGFGPSGRILATRDRVHSGLASEPEEDIFQFAVETTVYRFVELVDWEGWATRHPRLRFTVLIEQLDGEDTVMLYGNGSAEPSILLGDDAEAWEYFEGEGQSHAPDKKQPGLIEAATLDAPSARRLIHAGAEYGRIAAQHIGRAPTALQAPDVVDWLLFAPHHAICAWARAAVIARDDPDGQPRWIASVRERYEAHERWRWARVGELLAADRAAPTLVQWLAASGLPSLGDEWAAATLVLISAARHVWAYAEIPIAERVRVLAWLTGGVSPMVGAYPASLLVTMLETLDPATRQQVILGLLRHQQRAVRLATARLAAALAPAGVAVAAAESHVPFASGTQR